MRRIRRAEVTAEDGDWAEVWELFVEYVAEARKEEDAGANVGTNAAAERGEKWERDNTRTCYEGEATTREKIVDGAPKSVAGRRSGMKGAEQGESANGGEALARMAHDEEAEAEARRRGEREYESTLPEAFAGKVMDLEGSGVFKGRTDAAYERVADRDVARDPVARLFGRNMTVVETGKEMTTRAGGKVKMDKGNMAALTGPGNKATTESREAMRT